MEILVTGCAGLNKFTMLEMLRINNEIDRLIASIQVSLRIRTGCRVGKTEVVRRAVSDLAGNLDAPRLTKDEGTDKER